MDEPKSGQLGAGRVVTQKDVAELAGVSRAVVSYVVNNGPRVVSSETRERVLKAIEALGYRPNTHAQQLKFQTTGKAVGQIGIILGGSSYLLERPYFATVLANIYKEAHQHKQQIRFMTFFDELNDPVFFNKNIHPEVISGLIIVATELIVRAPNAQELLDRITERIDNIVTLEQIIRNLPAVIFDRVAAARQAVEHLISLGHTRIGFAGTHDNRLDGYQQAHRLHNVPLDPDLSLVYGTAHLPGDGYIAASMLMKKANPPTAIFATSDEVAIGAIAALRDRGLTVPDDVAVTSIDDIPLASSVRPALTTVRVPKESFGAYAMRILSTHADFPDSHQAAVVLPTELIVRESCGAKLAR
jgi:LacI family transcriptional regulator